MEPATAPQPDMAPELTPEEEQVSGAAASAVGVSGPPRPRPASARGGRALHNPGRRAPLPPGDRAPGRQPQTPGTPLDAAAGLFGAGGLRASDRPLPPFWW